MSYVVRTPQFSGPFDLLLQLVSRQKVDIGALSLAELADQYLAEVERMSDLDLDVASDFMLVASTLLQLKAASLLDQKPTAYEDPEDLDDELALLDPGQAREVLVARLLVYQQFRAAGRALGARMEAESRMHPRTAGPDPEFLHIMPDYLKNVTLSGLAVLCADLDARHQEFLLEAEHIAPMRRPLSNTVLELNDLMKRLPKTTFGELLAGECTPENVVVTFLAILELYKRGALSMEQSAAFQEIVLERQAGADDLNLDELMSLEAN